MQSKNKSNSQTKFSLNDKNFFDEVFNSLYTPLVFFANGILKNDQNISEDIIQDVFTNLLLKKKTFENYLSLKSYLYMSVKNSCYNHLKFNKVRGLYAENKKTVSTHTSESFLDQILKEEVQYELIAALKVLPKRCRQVFELSLNGLKNPEIAAEMNISIDTVKSQKKKGKTLLKRHLHKNPYLFLVILTFF
jgi:RNA polymerase sigma-70 factor (family 1)